MLLILQATPAQIARAKEVFAEDHAAFYGQPHGFKISECAAAHALFMQAGMPEDHEPNHGLNTMQNGNFGWLTSGGNVVLFNPTEGTVTYVGTRHGIAPLWVLEKPNSHKVLRYESSMPFLAPCETLANFAYRARLDSDCPIARGLALLNSGKPMTFLHAEFDAATVTEIKRVYAECVAHGYLPI